MPSEMKAFLLPGGVTLRFSATAWKTLHRYIQTDQRPEAGGVLLGRLLENGDVTIEEVTVPGKGDKSGRHFFDRGRQRAQKLVNEAWDRSGGEIRYLGEWHTHPERMPSPSGRDGKMIHNSLREAKMELSFLVLVIVGLESDWVGLRTYEKLVELQSL